MDITPGTSPKGKGFRMIGELEATESHSSKVILGPARLSLRRTRRLIKVSGNTGRLILAEQMDITPGTSRKGKGFHKIGEPEENESHSLKMILRPAKVPLRQRKFTPHSKRTSRCHIGKEYLIKNT